MHIDWSKLDNALRSIYQSFLDYHENPNDKRLYLDPVFKENKEKLFISVDYVGDVSIIQSKGFELLSDVGNGLLHGFIYYNDLPTISLLKEVKLLFYGTEGQLTLINSSVDIKAKKSPTSQGVWEMTGVSTDVLNPSTPAIVGNGGENVIIGIIDTGIDYNHENFLELTQNTTRILRIWDQGLIARSGESAPASDKTDSTLRYGVEYTKTLIDAELAKPIERRRAIRQQDKDGHGTHVAGIAAGNGRAYGSLFAQKYIYTGIAPLAKIVVVKYLDLDRSPNNTNPHMRFKDAVHYINKIGEELNMPVVINCSIGWRDGAHDGYGDTKHGLQEYLNLIYKNAIGKACVFALGNNYGINYYTKITIPSSGELEMDCDLNDTRTLRRNTEPLQFIIYYSALVNNLEVSIKVPHASSYSNVARLGQADVTKDFNVNKRVRLSNQNTTTQNVNDEVVSRNKITITLTPHGERFRTGTYTVKFTGPAGTELHLWRLPIVGNCSFAPQTPSVSPGSIVFSEDSTFNTPADAEKIISVGSYDASNSRMSIFSSHGKLVSYQSSPASYDKPEVSAPGTGIFSARSLQVRQPSTLRADATPDEIRQYINALFNLFYTSMQGTSMAAPHVAGLVALILNKNRNLSSQQIKDLLKDNAVANFLEPFPNDSSGRKANTIETGSGKIDALTTINNTPTP